MNYKLGQLSIYKGGAAEIFKNIGDDYDNLLINVDVYVNWDLWEIGTVTQTLPTLIQISRQRRRDIYNSNSINPWLETLPSKSWHFPSIAVSAVQDQPSLVGHHQHGVCSSDPIILWSDPPPLKSWYVSTTTVVVGPKPITLVLIMINSCSYSTNDLVFI